jgi:hypothetical protein
VLQLGVQATVPYLFMAFGSYDVRLQLDLAEIIALRRIRYSQCNSGHARGMPLRSEFQMH